MKINRKISSLLLTIIMFVTTFVSTNVFADTTFTNPSLYFGEDFEDDTVGATATNIANRFTTNSRIAQDPVSGNKYLVASDIVYLGSTGTEFATWISDRGCENWIFSFDLLLSTENSRARFYPRRGSSEISDETIAFNEYRNTDGTYITNDMKVTILNEDTGLTATVGKWMHVTYMNNGNGFDFYIDDVLVKDGTSTALPNVIYLAGTNRNFYVDNLKIYGFSNADVTTAVAKAGICRVKNSGLPTARLDSAVKELIDAENTAMENGTQDTADYTAEIAAVNDMITLYDTAISKKLLVYAQFKDDATFGAEVQNLLAFFDEESTGTAAELSEAVDSFETIFKRNISITEFSLCDSSATIKGIVIPAKETGLSISISPNTAGEIESEFTTDSDGKFSFDFNLEIPDVTGNYTVAVTSTETDSIPFDVTSINTKTFEIKNSADRTAALSFSSYSNANLSAFETELKTTNNFFYCLDMAADSDYDKLLDKNYVLEKLLDNKPYATVEDLKNEFVYHITMQRLRETTDSTEIARMLQNYYTSLTGDTLSEKYTTYKEKICELLPANIATVTDDSTLKKFIKTAEMYYVINSATRMSIADTFDAFVDEDEYYDILVEYGLDEDYKNVDSSVRIAAATSILDADLSITNDFNLTTEMEKLVSAVNTVVNVPAEDTDDSEDSDDTYKPSYSGGGGFGGVSIKKENPKKEEDTPAVPTPIVTPDSENKDYKDVLDTHWAADAIRTVRDKGIMTGDGSGNFYPDNYLKREEMAKVIVQAFNITSANAYCPFSDITDDMWCNKYIAIAVDAGLINGISEREFGFGNEMTRQDVAVIIYRYLSQKESSLNIVESVEFSDEAEIADYAKDAVKFMQQHNIMVGSDGRFNPRQPVTRAMAAKIICNIIIK